MIFHAPAKTFLIGEYVATAGGPAIVLATQPSFSLRIEDSASGLINIHPNSPAGQWYAQQDDKPVGLVFEDPYQGKGGLGASSAQFVLVYKAVKFCQQKLFNELSLLQAYYQYAWQGKGICPSGYDVLTQYARRTLFIDNQGMNLSQIDWPFVGMTVLLIHTDNKLSTHVHLAQQKQPSIDGLTSIVYQAVKAWEEVDAQGMIDAINLYHKALTKQQLVASKTHHILEQLFPLKGVLAAKGCGAMGADVILLLVDSSFLTFIQANIDKIGLSILAEIAISH